MKILAVVTYSHEMDTLREILQPTGHDVTFVNNWTETMKILTTDPFDLVIFRLVSAIPLLKQIQAQQPWIRSILLYDQRPEEHTANIALQWPVDAEKFPKYVTTATRNLNM